jgi:hypothetical protein
MSASARVPPPPPPLRFQSISNSRHSTTTAHCARSTNSSSPPIPIPIDFPLFPPCRKAFLRWFSAIYHATRYPERAAGPAECSQELQGSWNPAAASLGGVFAFS